MYARVKSLSSKNLHTIEKYSIFAPAIFTLLAKVVLLWKKQVLMRWFVAVSRMR